MSIFDKSFSYETLLETLKATHESRKKRYEERKHLLTDDDRIIEKTLFRLEDDAFTRSDYLEEKDVMFNFDDYMNVINKAEISTGVDLYSENESSNFTAPVRKHVCNKPGCTKAYTSSHGLKYHLQHGHTKEKENVHRPFVCNIGNCKNAYQNTNGLKYHIAKAHTPAKEQGNKKLD